ncbi:MAG: rhamnogalacturonan acetylesterase [Eubacteriales bacterium]|nr:rhamnogalacturonan acetylesterase [Eubacteriales bacterium]
MHYSLHPFHRQPERPVDAYPELTDGFLPEDSGMPGFIPVSYCSDALPAGRYALHVKLYALENVNRLFLFSGRKQLRDLISLKAGERYEATWYVSLAKILPRDCETIFPIERLFFSFCTEKPEAVAICLESCYGEAMPTIPAIFLCGDSTVTDQSSGIPYSPGGCYASWGQALPACLFGSVAIENQAHSGLTTETFRSEGHFSIVQTFLKPGDCCLFQFGHNDQKEKRLLANREYPHNLRRFAQEVMELGGVPILVTPLGRNIWKEQKVYHDLLADHAKAVKELANEMNLLCVDLHGYSVSLLQKLGEKNAEGYFHPGDYTHTNEYGAYRFASYIADELCRFFPFYRHLMNTPFQPPENLWEQFHPAAKSYRSQTQKERFDAMEKSTRALLDAIAAAKGETNSSKQA